MPTIATDLPPPLNHVFVDFENVHEVDLDVIGNKAVSFTLLVGPKQTKLDAKLVEKLFAHAASVQLVRLATSGKNALDFILTYYVGRAVAFDPTGCFHIISGDKGFDSLVKHLQGKRIDIGRHESFAALPFAVPVKAAKPEKPATAPVRAEVAKPKVVAKGKTPAAPPTLEVQVNRVLEQLRKPSATHPRKKEGLLKQVVNFLGKKITEGEAAPIVERLERSGHITIDEKENITYRLDASERI
jgi:hypothetical protein